MALGNLVFEDQARAQLSSRWQATIVCHDGYVVHFIHQNGGWIHKISYHLGYGTQNFN
jgi:hypothetical protein